MNDFINNLLARQKKVTSLVCGGIDPDTGNSMTYLPGSKMGPAQSIYNFCMNRVGLLAPYVCCFKLNFWFFFSELHEGIIALEWIVAYIQEKYPDIPIILDCKGGDIGNTVRQIMIATAERLELDALTINIYAGSDCATPYFGKVFPIALVRMSNKSAAELQDVPTTTGESDKTEPFYMKVARLVAKLNQSEIQCGIVAGATAPKEIGFVRKIVGGGCPILVPALGKQGGDVDKSVRNACGDKPENGIAMFNSSRGLIYAKNPKAAGGIFQRKLNHRVPVGFWN